MAEENPYRVLGVPVTATPEAVRRAYFELVKTNTPEAHPDQFKRIRAAYETLRSPLRRTELEVLTFDEPAAELDLEILTAAAGVQHFDASALLLAAAWSASDLNRTAFPGDESPLREEDLLDSSPA